MFWAVMLIVMVLLICVTVLIGLSLKAKRDPRQLSRQEMVGMAKASGHFKHRKSNRP